MLSPMDRRIEIASKHVLWNESGTLVCIATEENFFVLKYDAEAASKGIKSQVVVVALLPLLLEGGNSMINYKKKFTQFILKRFTLQKLHKWCMSVDRWRISFLLN